MGFLDRFNRVQLPPTPGVPLVFNLPQGNNVLWGKLILALTVTIAGSTANGTAIELGGIYRLVRSIKLIATKAAGSRYPNGAIVNCTPISLLEYAVTRHQGKFIGVLSGDPTLGNGANGAYTVYFSIPIFFAGQRHENDLSTALNMNDTDSQGNPVYNSVQVVVEFAQLANELYSGNNGTLAYAGMAQWLDERLPLGDTIPIVQEDHIALIQAANDRFVDAALPKGGRFTDILWMCQQGLPGAALSNNILTRVEAEGVDINLKMYAQDIQQDMVDKGFWDPSATLTGLYYMNFAKGNLSNSKRARRLAHRLSVNNPSGANLDQIKVYTRRIYPDAFVQLG